MLYKRDELPKSMADDNHVAITRYMYKFFNHRSEISRLKWHEKFYLFSHMYIMTDEKGRNYDLFVIPEAKEYLFYYLTLIYCGDYQFIDFTRKAYDYDGEIPKKTRNRHSKFFWRWLNEWSDELSSEKSIYLGIINVEFKRKMAFWSERKLLKKISPQQYIQIKKYSLAVFHHIYTLVRLYYDEKPNKYDIISVNGFDVVADIYSYSHVLARHYFPNIMSIDVTLNDDIPILDIKHLPKSLLKIVLQFCSVSIITQQTEYLLFSYEGAKYILWIKYGMIASANLIGFQIRSFYRCQEQRDIDKFIGKIEVSLENNLSCYI